MCKLTQQMPCLGIKVIPQFFRLWSCRPYYADQKCLLVLATTVLFPIVCGKPLPEASGQP